MKDENWYLGDKWDDETRQHFEQKLKKSRGSYKKAQYLRIKGSCLIGSSNVEVQQAGCELLVRVATEYPDESSNVMFAYEELGDYYFRKKDFVEAEANYRKSISFYSIGGRSGSSGIGDIKLIEVIIKSAQTKKFHEMFILLVEGFTKTGGSLLLNDDIFRYNSALAKLCDGLGEDQLAKECARKALEKSRIKDPQLDKYPKLGIINADTSELSQLGWILEK